MNRMAATVHRLYTRTQVQGAIHPFALFRVHAIPALTYALQHFYWTLPQAATFGCHLVKPISVYLDLNLLTRLEHLQRVLVRETFHRLLVNSSQALFDPFPMRS